MRAFSLVELSIVLVILGLLTGGILAGQSLIRAAELRSVSSEQQRWVSATYSFRDKYMGLPGDITNATAFWGKDDTNCTSHTGIAATPGTCNGNGTGIIDNAAAASATGETFQFWKQLALAGMIEGSYSGLSGPSDRYHTIGDTNIPSARVSNAAWAVRWFSADTNVSHFLLPNNLPKNHFVIGNNNGNKTWPQANFLSPSEAWNIDAKIDDGKPAQGRVLVVNWIYCTTATARTDLGAEYALSDSAKNCALWFPW